MDTSTGRVVADFVVAETLRQICEGTGDPPIGEEISGMLDVHGGD